jgi:predicted ATPase
LKLGPINVLIGANGSGKSNFLDVFRLMQAIGEGGLQNYVGRAGGAERILHFGPRATTEIFIGLWLSQTSEYEVRLLPTEDDDLFISDTSASGASTPSNTSPQDANLTAVGQWQRARLGGWRLYHLHDTASMRKTVATDDNRFLRPDGSNLPAFLYYLREKHRDSYNSIRRTIQGAAPFFDDFSLEPVRVNPDTIKLEWKHKISDQYFGASSLSDGTLALLLWRLSSCSPSAIGRQSSS